MNHAKEQQIIESIINDALDVVNKTINSQINICDIENKFKKYVKSVIEWGLIHNVISRNQTPVDVWENLYDSICLLSVLNNEFSRVSEKKIIDAGAGGGFPGIPLAIILSGMNFQLVDISRKKCSFLRMVKSLLNLRNIAIKNSDIKDIEPSAYIITKAAFSPSHIGVLASAIKNGGRLALWATPHTREAFIGELDRFSIKFLAKYDYDVPSGKKRSLLIFEKPSD